MKVTKNELLEMIREEIENLKESKTRAADLGFFGDLFGLRSKGGDARLQQLNKWNPKAEDFTKRVNEFEPPRVGYTGDEFKGLSDTDLPLEYELLMNTAKLFNDEKSWFGIQYAGWKMSDSKQREELNTAERLFSKLKSKLVSAYRDLVRDYGDKIDQAKAAEAEAELRRAEERARAEAEREREMQKSPEYREARSKCISAVADEHFTQNFRPDSDTFGRKQGRGRGTGGTYGRWDFNTEDEYKRAFDDAQAAARRYAEKTCTVHYVRSQYNLEESKSSKSKLKRIIREELAKKINKLNKEN